MAFSLVLTTAVILGMAFYLTINLVSMAKTLIEDFPALRKGQNKQFWFFGLFIALVTFGVICVLAVSAAGAFGLLLNMA